MSEGGSGGLEPSPEVGYVKAGKTAVTIAQMSGKTRLNGLSRFSSNWEVRLIGG
ncbi:hypothetical protein M5J14_23450 [Lysinibacillus sp. OL1_EC]|uniref:hypothetical protein n=1 Tax=Lysinibacillus sp. OL1 TaxID=2517243 RepID=UPI00187D48D7|nr:hypothetical protein [Lysinibacillus sp. OL1]MCM0627440.1 hypothetical protein [Lysinibacillus sp. OL1_EC]